MSKEQKIFMIIMTVLLVIALAWLIFPGFGLADNLETTKVKVTAKLLNGRSTPSKKASVEARFDRGDILDAIDWSENHHWVEVIGGETGTVWVWWGYLNEQDEQYTTWLNDFGKVKIRKEPYGTVIGYLKKGKEVCIDRVLLGWGHCSKGWIDLKYLTEED